MHMLYFKLFGKAMVEFLFVINELYSPNLTTVASDNLEDHRITVKFGVEMVMVIDVLNKLLKLCTR